MENGIHRPRGRVCELLRVLLHHEEGQEGAAGVAKHVDLKLQVLQLSFVVAPEETVVGAVFLRKINAKEHLPHITGESVQARAEPEENGRNFVEEVGPREKMPVELHLAVHDDPHWSGLLVQVDHGEMWHKVSHIL